MSTTTVELTSRYLREPRMIITSQVGSGRSVRCVALCMDGQWLPELVGDVCPSMAEAWLFVGVASNPETRDYDYIRGYDTARFQSHSLFISEEVVPFLVRTFGISESVDWGTCGFSNGGAWAHAAAVLNEFYSFAIAFSVADNRIRKSEYRVPQPGCYYLAAGTHEPEYLDCTREIAADLRDVGARCQLAERNASHDFGFWRTELPQAVEWLTCALPGLR